MQNDPELIVLGRGIRRLRQARALSIEALAGDAGVSTGHLGTIERGQGNPRLDTLLHITEALGITFEEIVRAGEDES